MIYFLRDPDNGAIKIGFTDDDTPARRKTGNQTGNSRPLELLDAIDGDRDTEAGLHRLYAEFRAEGEWFLGGESFVQEIKTLIAENGQSELRKRWNKVKFDIEGLIHEVMSIQPLVVNHQKNLDVLWNLLVKGVSLADEIDTNCDPFKKRKLPPAESFVLSVRERGMGIRVEGGFIKVSSPHLLTEEDRAFLRANKEAIIAFLTAK